MTLSYSEWTDTEMAPLLSEYQNGENFVSIHKDGTKIRKINGKSSFPDHCDVKITNHCTGAPCAAYCHEMSNGAGKHGDLQLLLDMWSDMPRGCEIAIGGGNPLDHPELINYLRENKKRGHISNLTINQYHLDSHKEIIENICREDLVYGLGLSTRNLDDLFIESLSLPHHNLVHHLILGVHSWEDFLKVMDMYTPNKVLLLGYKSWGNGDKYKGKTFGAIDDKIKNWKTKIPQLLKTPGTISFDNLAIKQLGLKNYFAPEKWEQFYCGDDGEHSMYVDVVKAEFAISSTSPERFPIENRKLKDCFDIVRK